MKKSCLNCKHYYITFDQQTPKGCKAYGIQSQRLPITVIKEATAEGHCLGFELKDRLKKRKKEKDLNDPALW